MQPLKGMGKGILLATPKPLEVDQIILEGQFVFSLQITTIKCRVIGRQAIRHVGVIEPADGFADRRQRVEGASLQIGAGT